jgi:hypothetical protein
MIHCIVVGLFSGYLFKGFFFTLSQVMYVGVTYTGNGPYRSEVPAVSSRSLDSSSLFQVRLAISSVPDPDPVPF